MLPLSFNVFGFLGFAVTKAGAAARAAEPAIIFFITVLRLDIDAI
jgi:hypothetical protein